MPKFSHIIQASIEITVEAEDKKAAEDAAVRYVRESLSPDEIETDAWNSILEEGEPRIRSTSPWSPDRISSNPVK